MGLGCWIFTFYGECKDNPCQCTGCDVFRGEDRFTGWINLLDAPEITTDPCGSVHLSTGSLICWLTAEFPNNHRVMVHDKTLQQQEPKVRLEDTTNTV